MKQYRLSKEGVVALQYVRAKMQDNGNDPHSSWAEAMQYAKWKYNVFKQKQLH